MKGPKKKKKKEFQSLQVCHRDKRKLTNELVFDFLENFSFTIELMLKHNAHHVNVNVVCVYV